MHRRDRIVEARMSASGAEATTGWRRVNGQTRTASTSAPRRWVYLILLVMVVSVNPYLRGDGVGYYAYLHSPMFDQDFDFRNEFAHADSAQRRNYFLPSGQLRPHLLTSTGRVSNQWSPGVALLWAPAVLAVHLVLSALSFLGVETARDGFSAPYLWALGATTAACAIGGTLITRRLAISLGASRASSSVAAIAVTGASSLLVYSNLLPYYPMAAAALPAGVLCVLVWGRSYSKRATVSIGLLAGFLASMHPLAIPWSLLVVAHICLLPRKWRFGGAGLSAAAWVVGFMPQLTAKTLVYGNPLTTGYEVPLRLLHPDFSRTWFGSNHGLFTWTPLAAIAIVGLILGLRDHGKRWFMAALLMVFLFTSYLDACGGDFSALGQSAFGNRYLVLFTPGFVVGTAVAVECARRHTSRTAIWGATAVGIAWNLLLLFQWIWGLTPKRTTAHMRTVISNQFTAAPQQAIGATRLLLHDPRAVREHIERVDAEEQQPSAR